MNCYCYFFNYKNLIQKFNKLLNLEFRDLKGKSQIISFEQIHVFHTFMLD